MNTSFTPGPWFNTSQDDSQLGEVMDQPLDSGCTLFVSVSGPNAKGDASLIAAAPALLHELEKAHQIITVLLNLVPSERKFEMAEALAKLHDGEGAVRYHERAAVLAKATGEQP